MSEQTERPVTPSEGATDAPVQRPPATVDASAPVLAPAPQRRPTRADPTGWRLRPAWRQAIDLALDVLDFAADRVAGRG